MKDLEIGWSKSFECGSSFTTPRPPPRYFLFYCFIEDALSLSLSLYICFNLSRPMEFGGGRRTTFPTPSSGGRSTEIGMGLTPSMNSNGCSSVDGPPAGAECIVREQDRFMPIANVIRIMRKILPSHAKISDDAKETIQECVSEFISFITGEANERCQREQRKTITAEDVLWAMSKLGFDDYIEPLTLYLHRHRQFDCGEQRGSFKPADQFGKRAVEPFPVTLPVSPTTYGGAPPPPPPHHQQPTGFFIPTPASPANGLSTTDNHSSNGTPYSSGQ